MYANMETATEVEACGAFPVANRKACGRVSGPRCGLDDLSSQTSDYEDYFDVRPQAPRRRADAEALGQPAARRLATPTILPTASPRTPLELASAAEPQQPPAYTSQYIQLNTTPIISYVISSTIVGRWTVCFERADAMEIS